MSAVNMSTNILDFDLFVQNKYIPKYSEIHLNQRIINHIGAFPQNITLYSNITNNVVIDDKKYFEIFNNGLINACGHNINNNIEIRTHIHEDYLVTEILNDTHGNVFVNESMFIPNFLVKNINNKMYINILHKFKLNDVLYQKIKPSFGVQLIPVFNHDETSNEYIKSESYGMGLSITRLIAKCFDGDSGVEANNDTKRFRFWFAIKFTSTNNKSDNLHDSIIAENSREGDSRMCGVSEEKSHELASFEIWIK
jgi:hypothetical protein